MGTRLHGRVEVLGVASSAALFAIPLLAAVPSMPLTPQPVALNSHHL